MMTLGTRKSTIWRSWGRRKLNIDLTDKVFQLNDIEPVTTVSPRIQVGDLGSSEPDAQITRIADIILLHRAQRLQ
jgi:hypothetical protein